MYLYVIASQGMVKVGFSKNPARRVYALRTGPWPVEIVATCKIPVGAERKLEAKVHNALAEFHRKGEWFDLNEWCAVTIMEHLATGKHSSEIADAVMALCRNRGHGKDGGAYEAACERLIAAGWEYAKQCGLIEDWSAWRKPRRQLLLESVMKSQEWPDADLKRELALQRAENVKARAMLRKG